MKSIEIKIFILFPQLPCKAKDLIIFTFILTTTTKKRDSYVITQTIRLDFPDQVVPGHLAIKRSLKWADFHYTENSDPLHKP